MNQEQEDEFLLHIAAGTDPLTALAALSREPEAPSSPQHSQSERSRGGIVWGVLVFAGLIAIWLVMQWARSR